MHPHSPLVERSGASPGRRIANEVGTAVSDIGRSRETTGMPGLAEIGTDRGEGVRLDVGCQNKESDMTHSGTESLIELANDLEAVAPNIEAWFDHTRAAALMRKAATEIRRLAPLDPDIDVAPGEN